MARAPDFLATCWTTAGDVVPGRTGDVSPFAVEERVAAAAMAGYRGFGIAAPDLEVVRDTIGYPALGQMLDENGLRHVEVEYLQDWWWPRGDRRGASDEVREVLFEAAAELGADHVKVGLGERENDFDEERFAGEFDRLATEAHAHGTRIALEPPALSMMATIAPAAELVRTVANPAGGLLVDIWHIFRSGTGYDQLVELLPPEYVFAVEISDSGAEMVGTLYDDTFDNRLPPGEGEFDVAGFIRALDTLGFKGPWGLEVMSTELRSLPVEVAAKRVFDAAVRVFEVARAGQEASA
jgi:sugar phosphate isomerase/epimerase